MRKRPLFLILCLYLPTLGLLSSLAAAQQPATTPSQNQAGSENNGRPYSGMYTFLKDGEFLQLSVEDHDRVSGFISRYEDEDNESGSFIDQFFKTAKLDGSKLSFTTKTVHAVWFDFNGTVERGEGKNPGDEAYYVLKGTLTTNSTDAEGKISSQKREVEFKNFPRGISGQEHQ